MPLRKLWLASCLTVLAVSPVFAQPGPPPGGRGGPPGDRGPGQRSGGNVAQASLEKLFQLDADKDGKLTKDEVADSRLQNLFARADADQDGNVTREEATALFEKEAQTFGRGGPGGPGGFGPPGGEPQGFGGPGLAGPPRPGQILPPFLHDALELSDKQREELQELQKEVDARLEKILSADQRRMLSEMTPRGPGGPGFGGPRGPGQRGPGPRGGRPPGE
ncbi:EF-hand domain-containing protein [Planctellipticum variicoloris]|uniref:EF-hand domain-containing protein n=1 Tax=Planctellipticum variicoloris TaxID=3064265 RepID=UPI0030141B90|nr:EF-hand domain-containing protein [Planctomycetaceae bacterium SH412]